MGFIYKIVNDINDKVYIGQTINTIEERFKEHLWCASNNLYKSKIYKAIRELGKEHFRIEKIIECDDKDLNRLEQFYVEEYKSLDNGYNSVFPISTNRSNISREIDDKIVELYLNNVAVTDIAILLNTSIESVNRATLIYERRGGIRRNKVVITNNKPVPIVMYDINFNPQKIFETKIDAYKHCVNNEGTNDSKFAFYSYTKVACQTGNISYGHRWQLLEDLLYENKMFRTKFDKIAYMNGGEAYQPSGQNYWVVDGALLSLVKTYNEEKENHCIDCGTVIANRRLRCNKCASIAKKMNSDSDNTIKNKCIDCGKDIGARNLRCVECEQKRRKQNIPDKTKLQDLISKYSYEEIGRKYNVTGKSVRKWCDSYGITIKKQEHLAGGCYCIINDVKHEFDTYKEAANWLINSMGYDLTLKSAQYAIGQSCKHGNKYKNIQWFHK